MTLLSVFLFIGSTLFLQDLIVTESGDSLNVLFEKIKSGSVHYLIQENGIVKDKRLPESKLAFFQPNFYRKSNDFTPSNPPLGIPANPINYHFRLALQAGYGFRTAKPLNSLAEPVQDYLRQTRNGWQIGGHLQFYFGAKVGAGLRYNSYHAQHEADFGITITDTNGISRSGRLSDDITIQYIAPELALRAIQTDQKGVFLLNLGVGKVSYRNDQYVVDFSSISGRTVGFHIGGGYDRQIAEHLYLGFKISYMNATLNRVTVNNLTAAQSADLPAGQREGLNRLDFSLGVSFGF